MLCTDGLSPALGTPRRTARTGDEEGGAVGETLLCLWQHPDVGHHILVVQENAVLSGDTLEHWKGQGRL